MTKHLTMGVVNIKIKIFEVNFTDKKNNILMQYCDSDTYNMIYIVLL